MKGNGHDSVSEIKGFLNAITMVNVNVNVQHTRMVSGAHHKHDFNNLSHDIQLFVT